MQNTGEEEEGDDELLRGPQEVARDEWMTKLPPERQVCITYYSWMLQRGLI